MLAAVTTSCHPARPAAMRMTGGVAARSHLPAERTADMGNAEGPGSGKSAECISECVFRCRSLRAPVPAMLVLAIAVTPFAGITQIRCKGLRTARTLSAEALPCHLWTGTTAQHTAVRPGAPPPFDAVPRWTPTHLTLSCSSEQGGPMGDMTPGMVCGHHHLYSSLARGMPAPPLQPTTFLEILEQIWWRLDIALDLE